MANPAMEAYIFGGKNCKQHVMEWCQQQKLPKPEFYTQQNQDVKDSFSFSCTAVVGGKPYATQEPMNTRKLAEQEASRLACIANGVLEAHGLQVPQVPPGMKKSSDKVTAENIQVNAKQLNEMALKAQEANMIVVSSLEEVFLKCPDDVMIEAFKSLLANRAQGLQIDSPQFANSAASSPDGTINGFVCKLTFGGLSYECNGIQQSKRMAELSASEVCLRGLGYLPPADYLIKPWEGRNDEDGFHARLVPKEMKEPGSKVYGQLLYQLCTIQRFQHPWFKTKVTTEESDGTQQMYTGICTFEGKAFQSRYPSYSSKDAQQNSAKEALAYLGIADPEAVYRLKHLAKVRSHPRHQLVKPFHIRALLTRCPSNSASYTHQHYIDRRWVDEWVYNTWPELPKEHENYNAEETRKKAFTELVDTPAQFGGKLLSEMDDIIVGEILQEKKGSVVTIGNKDFSVGLLLEDGKIFCSKQDQLVDVEPGCQLIGLETTKKFSFWSQQMYLKAIKCEDVLMNPDPSLQVITKCGLLIMMADHNTSPQIQLLLRRPKNTLAFLDFMFCYENYLRRQCKGKVPNQMDVGQVLEEVGDWFFHEVHMISEMTVESHLQIPSERFLGTQRDQWEPLFQKELPDDMKQIQKICTEELNRRRENGLGPESDVRPWSLPKTNFKHRLTSVGVINEDYIGSIHRAGREEYGVKLYLGELQDCPTVDLPIEDNKHPHKGDFARYLIYTGVKPVPEERRNEENGEVKSGEAETPRKDGKPLKRRREMDENKRTKMPRTEDEAEQKTGDDTDGLITRKPRSRKYLVFDECRWFEPQEAISCCPVLARISETKEFQDELQRLTEKTKPSE